MRLFGKPDNTINRFDRAQWLSCPFDMAFQQVTASGVPERTFAAPPRGTTYEATRRGSFFVAAPRGTTYEPGQN